LLVPDTDGLVALAKTCLAGEGVGAKSKEVWKKMAADGYAGVGWPKEWGGRGLTPIEQFVFFDESMRAAEGLGAAGPPPGRPSGSVLNFGRYAGWSLGEIARHDLEYIEWLDRAPIGRNFRDEVDKLLRSSGRRRSDLVLADFDHQQIRAFLSDLHRRGNTRASAARKLAAIRALVASMPRRARRCLR
jgi:hypothetical protein